MYEVSALLGPNEHELADEGPDNRAALLLA